MRILVPLALCASGLTTGCASGMFSNAPTDRIDTAKVTSIERTASQHGTDIYWINYPRRKVAETSPAPAAIPRGDGSLMVLPTGS